jgi:hypothetical protein
MLTDSRSARKMGDAEIGRLRGRGQHRSAGDRQRHPGTSAIRAKAQPHSLPVDAEDGRVTPKGLTGDLLSSVQIKEEQISRRADDKNAAYRRDRMPAAIDVHTPCQLPRIFP